MEKFTFKIVLAICAIVACMVWYITKAEAAEFPGVEQAEYSSAYPCGDTLGLGGVCLYGVQRIDGSDITNGTTISSIGIRAYRGSYAINGGEMTIYIFTGDSSTPTGLAMVGQATGQLAWSDMSTSLLTLYTLELDDPFQWDEENTYWIQLGSQNVGVNPVFAYGYVTTDPYDGGDFWIYNNQSSTWTENIGFDIGFILNTDTGDDITFIYPENEQVNFVGFNYVIDITSSESRDSAYIEIQSGTQSGVYNRFSRRANLSLSAGVNSDIIIPISYLDNQDTQYFIKAFFYNEQDGDLLFTSEEITYTTGDEYYILALEESMPPIDEPTATTTISSLNFSCDDQSGVWHESWCRLYKSLFAISPAFLNRWENFKTEISKKPPFGYVEQYKKSFDNMDSATSTPYTLGVPDEIIEFLEPLKTGLAWALWVLLGINVIYFVSKHL